MYIFVLAGLYYTHPP